MWCIHHCIYAWATATFSHWQKKVDVRFCCGVQNGGLKKSRIKGSAWQNAHAFCKNLQTCIRWESRIHSPLLESSILRYLAASLRFRVGKESIYQPDLGADSQAQGDHAVRDAFDQFWKVSQSSRVTSTRIWPTQRTKILRETIQMKTKASKCATVANRIPKLFDFVSNFRLWRLFLLYGNYRTFRVSWLELFFFFLTLLWICLCVPCTSFDHALNEWMFDTRMSPPNNASLWQNTLVNFPPPVMRVKENSCALPADGPVVDCVGYSTKFSFTNDFRIENNLSRKSKHCTHCWQTLRWFLHSSSLPPLFPADLRKCAKNWGWGWSWTFFEYGYFFDSRVVFFSDFFWAHSTAR